jgi:hypothetical protein
MTRSHLLPLVPLFLLVLAPHTARSQTTAPPGPAGASAPPAAPADTPAVVVSAPPPPPAPPVLGVPSVQLAVPWTGLTGEGVGLGLEEGGWSGVWGTGLRIHIPFFSGVGEGGNHGGSFGATLRGLVLTGPNTSTAEAPADHFGGRLELVGRSPVFLNLLRIYGGGGVELFSAFGTGVSRKALVSGGGQFGFEFFLVRRFSFFLEVGGHGGVDAGLPGGETVIAGMNVYPFSS